MTRKIKTYQDLLDEEQRLKLQLGSYKDLIRQDVEGIKTGLNPFRKIADKVKGLFSRGDNGFMMNFGLNFGVDVLIRKLLLARAGWIAKIVVPYLVKNYASHLVTENQRKAMTKTVGKFLSKFFSRKNKKSTPSQSSFDV